MGLVVVGRGLVGAAAARHLAEAGEDVTLIGPTEPDDWTTYTGPFSSSYDSGRITRVADANPVWATLAQRSIDRYRGIEERSGIDFHGSVGLVTQVPDLQPWLDTSPTASRITQAEVADRFGIHLPHENALFEPGPAGFIDPRRMIEAQVEAARRAGAVIRDEVVTELPTGERVLIATGAFAPELVPGIALERRRRTTLLAETDPRPELPCAIVREPVDGCESIYWVPPTTYPDGRTRLKIGLSGEQLNVVDDPDELRDWFRGDGSAEDAELLHRALVALMPDLDIHGVTSKPCVITKTETGLPFIGEVDKDLIVAVGGNGSAGKSADEIGRLGAELLLHGRWTDPELNESLFTPVTR